MSDNTALPSERLIKMCYCSDPWSLATPEDISYGYLGLLFVSFQESKKGLYLFTALCKGQCGTLRKATTIPSKAAWEQCDLHGPWERCRLLLPYDMASELCAAAYQTFSAASLII